MRIESSVTILEFGWWLCQTQGNGSQLHSSGRSANLHKLWWWTWCWRSSCLSFPTSRRYWCFLDCTSFSQFECLSSNSTFPCLHSISRQIHLTNFLSSFYLFILFCDICWYNFSKLLPQPVSYPVILFSRAVFSLCVWHFVMLSDD